MMSTLREIVGTNLRAVRRAKGISQAAVAEGAQLSVDMLGRIERGTVSPSFETIEALARVLGITPASFFGTFDFASIETDRARALQEITVDLAHVTDHREQNQSLTLAESYEQVLAALPKGRLNLKDASARLGIPEKVLRDLRIAGHFPDDTSHFGRGSYSVPDLDDFVARAFQNVGADLRHPNSISLGRALFSLRFLTETGGRDLVVAVVEGNLTPVGKIASDLGGVLLDGEEVKTFIARMPKNPSDRLLDAEVAGPLLGTGGAVIAALADQGFLTRVGYGHAIQVTQKSVDAFAAEYVRTRAIADSKRVAPRRVIEACRVKGIELLTIGSPRGHILAHFARRVDVDQLEILEVPRRDTDPAKIERVTAIIRDYINRRREDGLPLPRWNGQPNRSEIARVCGLTIGVFSRSPEAAALLEEYDEEDLARFTQK